MKYCCGNSYGNYILGECGGIDDRNMDHHTLLFITYMHSISSSSGQCRILHFYSSWSFISTSHKAKWLLFSLICSRKIEPCYSEKVVVASPSALTQFFVICIQYNYYNIHFSFSLSQSLCRRLPSELGPADDPQLVHIPTTVTLCCGSYHNRMLLEI